MAEPKRREAIQPGKPPLDDEMRPSGEAEPVRQREPGREADTAGQHGAMKPESARGIPERKEE